MVSDARCSQERSEVATLWRVSTRATARELATPQLRGRVTRSSVYPRRASESVHSGVHTTRTVRVRTVTDGSHILALHPVPTEW